MLGRTGGSCFTRDFYSIRDEICDPIFRSWKENQLGNAFHQVWNATSFPNEKTRSAVPGPSAPLSTLPS